MEVITQRLIDLGLDFLEDFKQRRKYAHRGSYVLTENFADGFPHRLEDCMPTLVLWLIDEKGFTPPSKSRAMVSLWGWEDFAGERLWRESAGDTTELFDRLKKKGILDKLIEMHKERERRSYAEVMRDEKDSSS